MTYSDDIINLVLRSVKEGYSVSEVSKLFKISIKTVHRLINLYMDINSNYLVTPTRKRSNRKFDEYADRVVDYVKQNIGCSIYDIYLYGCGKEISLSTISSATAQQVARYVLTQGASTTGDNVGSSQKPTVC